MTAAIRLVGVDLDDAEEIGAGTGCCSVAECGATTREREAITANRDHRRP